MTNEAKKLRRSLRRIGLTDEVIEAAWPAWWSEEAEGSLSAVSELRFSVARKLGVAPGSLFDDNEATFVWRDEAKFKGLRAETNQEQAALASFGVSVARLLVMGLPMEDKPVVTEISATELRNNILARGQFVALADLLAVAWTFGVPIIHLKLFPLSAKRMAAMAVKVAGRYAILLGHDAKYPAPIAFHIAHEFGHIFQGHLADSIALIDYADPIEQTDRDEEENAADRYALELTTGRPEPNLTFDEPPRNPRELAASVIRAGFQNKIEPGNLALCFGYQTGNWAMAQAALKHVYVEQKQVWHEVNSVASRQLNWSLLSDDNVNFLRAVMGGLPHD